MWNITNALGDLVGELTGYAPRVHDEAEAAAAKAK
jgi:hypothetical protein